MRRVAVMEKLDELQSAHAGINRRGATRAFKCER